MDNMNKNGLDFEIMTVGAIRTNCYIVKGEDDKCFVVDPGAEAERIMQHIKELGLQLDAILLTHGHFDHIMAVDEIRRDALAKVYASATEQKLLEDPELNCTLMGAGKAMTVTPDVTVLDQEHFEAAGIDVQVISTPGHTAGSVCYYLPEYAVVFCGDTVFLESVGRTDLPTGSGPAVIQSLNERILPLPPETKLYPGHGSDTTVAYERNNNPYAR